MGIAVLWPLLCVTVVSTGERSPRQLEQLLPPGWNIDIGVQRPSGQQQLPLVQSSTQFNRDPWTGNNTCGPMIADSGTLGLNIAFPELTISVTGSMPLNQHSSAEDFTCEYDPDMDLTTPQMIRRHNYPAESHWVITDDGYILEMHRIPKNGAPAVLLHHGIMLSSASWVFNGPNNSLAYLLSDAGMDVWMGNYRGTVYSKRHLALRPDDHEFWNFSDDEMGIYDLPAQIDHILRITQNEQIDFIGHSMGCAGFYIMMSKMPEYNTKIRQMHSLAPVIYGQGLRTPLKLLFPYLNNYDASTELLANQEFMRAFGRRYCTAGSVQAKIMCDNAVFLIIGYDSIQLNQTKLPLYMSHIPAGTSLKSFIKLTQAAHSDRFCEYDYGQERNLEVYGSISPPDYNISKTSCPVHMYYGLNDWINHPKNIFRISRQFPNLKSLYQVPFAKFNHLDFVWAKDAKKLLYNRIIRNLAIE